MSATVLAVDQGTSGTKVIVLDESGAVLAIAEEPVRPRYLAGGGVEQDPLELLESVLVAGRRAVATAAVAIDVVALANQGETVLNWDRRTGEPLSPAIVWQDRRSEALCAAMSSRSEEIAQRTGLVLDPYFSAPKLAWLRAQGFSEGVVTTSDSWLIHRLTGEFVTDASTASRSLLIDIDSCAWDSDLLEAFGLGDEALPRIVGNDEIIATTTAFGGESAVGGLVVDQQAALLAQSCLEPGEAKCTFGTGAFLLVNVGSNAVRSTGGLTTSVAWATRTESRYCVDGQIYTAGSAVRWLQDVGLVAGPDRLDSTAADDAAGVLCVPALAGLAAPWWRPAATASITGMTLSTGPGQLVRAVLDGIAAQVAQLAEVMAVDLGSPLTTLRVDGGLTRSRVLMQAVADQLQIPVEVYPSPHATGLGAAALGRVALDQQLGLRAAVPSWTASMTYEPRWSADRAQDFRKRWRSVAALDNQTGISPTNGSGT